MVAELGWVLYSALDYGLGQAEERELSPPLHNLIEQMTSAVRLRFPVPVMDYSVSTVFFYCSKLMMMMMMMV
ncbi:KIND domain [Trinorchestia longiramus]|nr:KIND domain [Trinorchestia longiramus]